MEKQQKLDCHDIKGFAESSKLKSVELAISMNGNGLNLV